MNFYYPTVLLPIALLLTSCGNAASDNGTPTIGQPIVNAPVTVYDEAVGGPLPYSLTSPSSGNLAAYTFTLSEGTYIVKGTSTSGESFALDIPNGFYLKTITVSFYTNIDFNDHILNISRLYNFYQAPFWNVYSLPTIGTYTYSLDLPDESIGNGVFSVYSGTSVQGASHENPFSLSFLVARIPL